MRLVRCQQQSCCSQHTTRISFAVSTWAASPPPLWCAVVRVGHKEFLSRVNCHGRARLGGGGWGVGGVRSTLPDSVTVNARELYSSCSFWSRGLLNIISSWSMWSHLSLKPAVSVLSQSIHVPTRITSRADSTRSRRASMCQP